MVIDPNGLSTFEWFYQHLGLIGWPLLISIVWKARGWFGDIKETAGKAVTQIDKMAVEQFPSMTQSLKTQDEALKSVDNSLKTLVSTAQFVTAQPVKRKRRAKSRSRK